MILELVLMFVVTVVTVSIVFRSMHMHDTRVQKILNKFVDRANLCLYDVDTGKKFALEINIVTDEKYDPCTGDANKTIKHAYVKVICMYNNTRICIAIINRAGRIMPTRIRGRSIYNYDTFSYKVFTRNGKNYLAVAPISINDKEQ